MTIVIPENRRMYGSASTRISATLGARVVGDDAIFIGSLPTAVGFSPFYFFLLSLFRFTSEVLKRW
jgi:hypothetical protein